MTIKQKLFLLTVLPSVTILLFSVNHILDKYNVYHSHEHLVSSSTLINNTASILHELQLERGLSSSYVNKKNSNDAYFKSLLLQQHNKTDEVIEKFNLYLKKLDKNHLVLANQEFIDNIDTLLSSINRVRTNILNNTLTDTDSFTYYTHINSQLLELSQSIKFYSNDEETLTYITALKKLMSSQELYGQERGLVLQLNGKQLSQNDLQKFNTIWEQQKSLHTSIEITLRPFDIKIDAESDNGYISEVRNFIKNRDGNSLTVESKKWFTAITAKVDDYHILGRNIYAKIVVNVNKKNRELYDSFIYQIIITLSALFSLLLGAYLISKEITRSLIRLDAGMDAFFDFLNFKTDAPKDITTGSKDELSDMADKINRQIEYLMLNIERDKKFILETTEIVTKMKEGDFTNQPHLEPTNPNLIELKSVFNELIQLISDKITQQTQSLETLNKSLEEKVYSQTFELERQIVEVTNARDAAIEAEKAKDDFLANMSHEIRTPLNAILGFVTILNKRIKDEKSLNYLHIIDTSGHSLLRIINDILDFSKIKSGKFTISHQNIDPMREFSDITLLFASKAYEKHLTYAVYIDPNLPKTISIDDTRVKQILSNLLSNAIKFTSEDGVVKVNISVDNNTLIMSVQDSGIGIAPESQKKIFNPFSQADNSTTRKYGGTGLGLSISHKLAELMNGTLAFSSQEGVGSTFTLRIPINIIDNSHKSLFDLNIIKKYRFAILNISKEDEIFARLIKKYLIDFGITNVIEINEYTDKGYDILFFVPDDLYNDEIIESNTAAIAMIKSNMVNLADFVHITALYAPFAPTSIIQAIDNVTVENIQRPHSVEKTDDIKMVFSGNILIAEDNKTNQLLISVLLDDYNINYHIVDDGKKAVEIFKQRKFDLVLMDENMPELNGIAAMKQIKEYEIKNKLIKTPIIAVTANALTTDIEKFFNEGMDGFLAKPINNRLLEQELHKHLKRL